MTIRKSRVAILVLAYFLIPLAASASSMKLYAAGSLKTALGDVVKVYEERYAIQIVSKFGPSGILRKSIENGETPDIFASANMAHPETLAMKEWGSPVVLFARNKLCAIAQPEVELTTATLLDTLMDENVRLGTSTPKADPSGDYAWKLFEKADKVMSGSFALLSEKALQLTGGPESVKAPEGLNKYGWVMAEYKADVFLTYCTNAVLAQKEVTRLDIVKIPEELTVGADYGLLINKNASVEAWRFGMFVLSPEGQKILSDYGFEATAVKQNK